MASKSHSTRWLAPLALVVAALATVVVIFGSGGTASTSRQAASPASEAAGQTKAKTTGARFYTVRSGDTLTSISIDVGVSVSTIEALNPGLDSQALQPGQRLRLRS